MAHALNSIVIPVYRNEESLLELIESLNSISAKNEYKLEVVFVVDGSPDQSYEYLRQKLPQCHFSSQLLLLSRNFGSFSAIRAGLAEAKGDFFAVMAADLQESVELPFQFFKKLEKAECDLVFGQRNRRQDPWLSALAARLFWHSYRKWVQREMPPGGVDIFGCNQAVRNQILLLNESNTTLVGLLLWIGFRRDFIEYDRYARPYGKSAWSLRKKMKYLLDSSFAFSDLPIRFLTLMGMLGMTLSFIFGFVVVICKWLGAIPVPGYSALAILILFFGGLNSFGLGVLGEYLWRTFENTKVRPNYIVLRKHEYNKI